MIVRLDRVVFDHAIGPPEARALHIRRDRMTPAAARVAAYALAPTRGQRLTVVAEFTFTKKPGVDLPHTIEIRGRAVGPKCGVLGDIEQRVVRVAAGPTGPIPFALLSPALHEKGVGKYHVSWSWQFLMPGSNAWVSFKRSDHVVYVTLDAPGAPWTQATGNFSERRWPWTRMLDTACEWASGVTLANGPDAAKKMVAARIEAGIHGLGKQQVLAYGRGSSGNFIEGTSAPVFKASRFVRRVLEGHDGETPLDVYCTECNVALAVMANALGADLVLKKIRPRDQSRMMPLNRIEAIGARRSSSPSFSYHEVAIREAASGATQVFDACLRPDWDTSLRNRETKFQMTQGRRLGTLTLNAKGTGYLQRLLEPDGRLWQGLEVVDGVMPFLDKRDAGQPIQADGDELQQIWRRKLDRKGQPILEFEPPANIRPLVLAGFRVYRIVSNPSHLSSLGPLVSDSAGFAYVRVRRQGGRDRLDERFRISMAWSTTAGRAREALAWLMIRNDKPLVHLRQLGDAAFATPGQRTVYMVRGNALARIVSIGRTLVPAGPIAARVDAEISGRQRRKQSSARRRP